MRFAALVAAACAGVLVALALPSRSDLNPFRMVFHFEPRRMQAPLTPEQTGFHGSPVVLTPSTLPPPLKLDLGQSLDPQGEYELQRNNRRMQDMRVDMRDPSRWTGPPPN